MQTHSEFNTPTEEVLKRPPHTFVQARDPWRDVKTRVSQVETQVLCKILTQKQEKFFLSMGDVHAISLKWELTELFEEKELLKQNCL